MEAFRQIAANDAISIAECINRQYVRRRLAAQFPGQPVLVYFTLTPPVINDRAATVNMLCQLAGQRWRATDEAVSEEVGVEVHTEEAAPQPPMMNTNPHTPGTPPAEPVLNAGECRVWQRCLTRQQQAGCVSSPSSTMELATCSLPGA